MHTCEHIESIYQDANISPFHSNQFANETKSSDLVFLERRITNGEALTEKPVLYIHGRKSLGAVHELGSRLLQHRADYFQVKILKLDELLDGSKDPSWALNEIEKPQHLFITHSWSQNLPLISFEKRLLFDLETTLRNRFRSRGKITAFQSKSDFLHAKWIEGWWSSDFHDDLREMMESIDADKS